MIDSVADTMPVEYSKEAVDAWIEKYENL